MKHYKLYLELSILIILIGCSRYPELGDGYKFDYDGRYTLSIVDLSNNIVITETILDYAFDSTFIIVSQRPWDSIPNIKTMNYTESNKAFAYCPASIELEIVFIASLICFNSSFI